MTKPNRTNLSEALRIVVTAWGILVAAAIVITGILLLARATLPFFDQ